MIGFIHPKASAVNVRQSPTLDAPIAGVLRGWHLFETAVLPSWHEGKWQRIDAEAVTDGATIEGWVHTDFVVMRESALMTGRRFIDLDLPTRPTIAVNAREQQTIGRVLQALGNYITYTDEYDDK